MNLLSFAARNMARARQRTWVVVGAMAFAGFIMIYYAALLEGLIRTTEKNAIGMELGRLQIHAPEYRDDPDLYKRVENVEAVLANIESAGFHGTPRLYGVGLAAAGSASAGIQLRGVDLDREPRVTRMHQHLLAGGWLAGNDPAGVVIGRKLAKTLGVGVGDEVVIVSQAADGSMANDLFRVRGILKSVGVAVDRAGFFMSAGTFRELMVIPEGVHEIAVVHRDGGDDLERLTSELAAMLPHLEIKNWRQLQPVVARIVDLSKYSLLIMLMVTYTAVGILTLNGMLMNVFERINELGVMKALGVSPWNVFTLIVTEAMLQVSVAAVLALATGVPLALFCQTHPLDLTFLASTSSTIGGVAIDPLWYSRVTPGTVLVPVLFLYGISGLAILYPALKAALIRPVQAIYHR